MGNGAELEVAVQSPAHAPLRMLPNLPHAYFQYLIKLKCFIKFGDFHCTGVSQELMKSKFWEYRMAVSIMGSKSCWL